MAQILYRAEILNVLKSARLFSQFEDNQLLDLIGHSMIVKYKSGDVIVREAKKNDHFFVLIRGTVAVYAEDELVITMYRQGDIFGEMSVISRTNTTASVIAKTDVRLFTVPASDIYSSENTELRSMVFKIFLDILTDKLALTTIKVKGFQATTDELSIKKAELAETEDNLLQKEVILQSVLGSMSDGVVVTDVNGNLLDLNNAFRDLFHPKKIPDSFEDWPNKLGFFHTDEKTLFSVEELPTVKVLHGQEVDSEEIYIINSQTPEGIWLQASSRLLKAENSKTPIGAVTVFRDYTKKKKEEQALIKAKENAEAMAKAKSDFLAVMSHELRTPLNGIMGMTDLLYSTNLTGEQKDCVNTICTSSENLLSMVMNILDYNNLETDTFKAENRAFSIQNVFSEISSIYKLHARKKNIQLSLSISDEIPPQVIGFERGLQQVIRNLTENAIKFTQEGKVVLSAELKSKDRNIMTVFFAVSDTGIGIREDQVQHLFKPFTQVDSSYARKFEGTGIGLSLCKKLVEHMKGSIKVESDYNKGSNFIFQIPFLSVEMKKEDNNKRLIPVSKSVTSGKQNQDFAKIYPKNILVVEDNIMNQKLILKVLKKLGYKPELAKNGLEAVKCVEKEIYDLILMDLQMPEMDGIEATKVILEQLRINPKPSIVALTANVSEDVKQTCFDIGMREYITKPLKVDVLKDLLKNLK